MRNVSDKKDKTTACAGADGAEQEATASSSKQTFFRRFGDSFSEMLQASRGSERIPEPAVEKPRVVAVPTDDIAIRRGKPAGPKRMIIPEGALVGGSVTCAAETEIGGRIEGDVIVDGRLVLSSTGLVTGCVQAVSCRIDGVVEGKAQCAQDLEIGPEGRVNSDVVVGQRVLVAGRIDGSVSTGGTLRLVSTGVVEGNIVTRQLVIEEGAVLNGDCVMRTAAQRSEK
jgi:cytoskeletal protein CcmA (bactofilin family)